MNKTIITLLCCIFTLSSFADNQAEAHKVLNALAAKIEKGGGATATFTMKTAGNTISGNVAIRNSRFYLTTPSMTVWYNGKTQWIYSKLSEEVNISAPNAGQQSVNPYAFLYIYKNGYSLTMKTQGQTKTIRMVSKKHAMKDITITLGKGDVPTMVKFLQGGKWTTVSLTNFKVTKLPDSLFVFNPKKYPDAEIIDLR